MQNNRMRSNNEAKDIIPEPEIGVGAEARGSIQEDPDIQQGN